MTFFASLVLGGDGGGDGGVVVARVCQLVAVIRYHWYPPDRCCKPAPLRAAPCSTTTPTETQPTRPGSKSAAAVAPTDTVSGFNSPHASSKSSVSDRLTNELIIAGRCWLWSTKQLGTRNNSNSNASQVITSSCHVAKRHQCHKHRSRPCYRKRNWAAPTPGKLH